MKLEARHKLKKFLMAIYREGIGEGNNLAEGEYIRVLQNNKKENQQLSFEEHKEFTGVNFFRNIDDIVDFAFNVKSYHRNTYFNLATTDGVAGTNENLINRYFLAFDFDKKDLGENFNHKDILNLFSKIKLHYHILVDSGNGYHAYVLINKTDDIKLVSEVTNALIDKLGADKNANLTTQVLRVPYTWNIKDKPKKVKIIHQDKVIHRYDIEKLAKRFCRDVKTKSDKNIKYILDTNIPECIVSILENGSKDGGKNSDLQKIVVSLRLRNKTEAQVLAIAREWNSKSENGFSDNDLEYQTKYMYEKLKGVDFGCGECTCSSECWSKIESDFIYNDDDILISVSETTMKTLKNAKRKGVKKMEGNDLVIYGILKSHNDGLFYNELEKELTYKKKCRFSKPTIIKALDNLSKNNFIEIEIVGRKKLYKLTNTRNKIDLTYNISFAATFECIKGNITSEELKLYNYMRYLHHKEQRENPKALKGNLFQMTQRELAKELGMTQQNISLMITNLLEEKIISIWYRQTSNNNGFDYYVYRLNY